MPVKVEQLCFSYKTGTPFEKQVLFDLDLEVADGEFLGIVGPTQSGKTTLAQHFNGLLSPQKGRVIVDGQDIAAKKVDLVTIRRQIGYVFQNPEHQLFKPTVGEDIAFGPLNQKLPKQEIAQRVREAMALVGLDYDRFYHRDIFSLSGGQKRRAAVAGVLACCPKMLILDDVTAGLDPKGREDILGVVETLHREKKITMVFISSSMDGVARVAKRIVVLHRGRIIGDGPAREIFSRVEWLKEIGLGAPQVIEIMHRLRQAGHAVPVDLLTVDEAIAALVTALHRQRTGAEKRGAD